MITDINHASQVLAATLQFGKIARQNATPWQYLNKENHYGESISSILNTLSSHYKVEPEEISKAFLYYKDDERNMEISELGLENEINFDSNFFEEYTPKELFLLSQAEKNLSLTNSNNLLDYTHATKIASALMDCIQLLTPYASTTTDNPNTPENQKFLQDYLKNNIISLLYEYDQSLPTTAKYDAIASSFGISTDDLQKALMFYIGDNNEPNPTFTTEELKIFTPVFNLTKPLDIKEALAVVYAESSVNYQLEGFIANFHSPLLNYAIMDDKEKLLLKSIVLEHSLSNPDPIPSSINSAIINDSTFYKCSPDDVKSLLLQRHKDLINKDEYSPKQYPHLATPPQDKTTIYTIANIIKWGNDKTQQSYTNPSPYSLKEFIVHSPFKENFQAYIDSQAPLIGHPKEELTEAIKYFMGYDHTSLKTPFYRKSSNPVEPTPINLPNPDKPTLLETLVPLQKMEFTIQHALFLNTAKSTLETIFKEFKPDHAVKEFHKWKANEYPPEQKPRILTEFQEKFSHPHLIPVSHFEALLNTFPNTTHPEHYFTNHQQYILETAELVQKRQDLTSSPETPYKAEIHTINTYFQQAVDKLATNYNTKPEEILIKMNEIDPQVYNAYTTGKTADLSILPSGLEKIQVINPDPTLSKLPYKLDYVSETLDRFTTVTDQITTGREQLSSWLKEKIERTYDSQWCQHIAKIEVKGNETPIYTASNRVDLTDSNDLKQFNKSLQDIHKDAKVTKQYIAVLPEDRFITPQVEPITPTPYQKIIMESDKSLNLVPLQPKTPSRLSVPSENLIPIEKLALDTKKITFHKA